MTRKLLPILMAGFAAVAHAQTDPNDATITAAFAAWRQSPTFSVELTGTQVLSGVSYDVASELSFSLQPNADGQELALFDVIRKIRRSGTQKFQVSQRVVGDGYTMYHYEPLNGQYSAQTYAPFRGPLRSPLEQTKYLQTALAMLAHSVGDSEALTVRLLREVYGSDAAMYHRWIPDAVPEAVPTGIQYAAGAPSYRTFLFNFDQVTGALVSIDSHDSRRNGQMVADFTLVPSATLLPIPALFQPYDVTVVGRWRLVADLRAS